MCSLGLLWDGPVVPLFSRLVLWIFSGWVLCMCLLPICFLLRYVFRCWIMDPIGILKKNLFWLICVGINCLLCRLFGTIEGCCLKACKWRKAWCFVLSGSEWFLTSLCVFLFLRFDCSVVYVLCVMRIARPLLYLLCGFRLYFHQFVVKLDVGLIRQRISCFFLRCAGPWNETVPVYLPILLIYFVMFCFLYCFFSAERSGWWYFWSMKCQPNR